MPNKFYSLPKSVFEYYHAKLKDWVRAVLPTKTSDLTNDSDFLDQLALAGIIASTFSTSSTYAVGDYVLYNHTLYRCKTAISTAGAWDASKWDATKTQDIFQGSAPGLVPAPASGVNERFLAPTGLWVPFDYATDSDIDDMFADSIAINGKDYKVVTIGNQMWTAENLDTVFDGISYNTGGDFPVGAHCWYYNRDAATYGPTGENRGLLYTYACLSIIQTWLDNNLPGWRIPVKSDGDALISLCGGEILTFSALASDRLPWNYSVTISNDYGLSMIPTGRRMSKSYDAIEAGFYWTSTLNQGSCYLIDLSGYSNGAGGFVMKCTTSRKQSTNYDACAIRLVKDLT